MERRRNPSLEEIDDARDEKPGDFGNQVLYRPWANSPRHKVRGVIAAKVNIIGSVYAVSIERGRGPKGDAGDDFWQDLVVPKILNENIDSWF
nr:hypothetical protein [Candidatus Acidoferrales bacterium]